MSNLKTNGDPCDIKYETSYILMVTMRSDHPQRPAILVNFLGILQLY